MERRPEDSQNSSNNNTTANAFSADDNDTSSDELFRSLLTTQRVLLNQINIESALQGEEAKDDRSFIADGDFLQPRPLGVQENKPIFTSARCNVDDKIRPQRIGVASDIPFAPHTATERNRAKINPFENRQGRSHIPTGFSFDQEFEDSLARKKPAAIDNNELSALSLLELEKYQRAPVASLRNVSNAGDPSLALLDSKPPSSLGPSEVLSVMESFSAAMERSQKSQKDIHDWDRKMGLKRSHSKTMRLSARSRKKLQVFMKRQIKKMSSKIP